MINGFVLKVEAPKEARNLNCNFGLPIFLHTVILNSISMYQRRWQDDMP